MKNGFFILGTGTIGNLAYHAIGIEGIAGFCDNNPDKVHGDFHGMRVFSFEEIVRCAENHDIVIACKAIREVGTQLVNAGINEFYVFLEGIGLKKVHLEEKQGIMEFLQIRIVDHCNLNCKNCGSVCNEKTVPWEIEATELENNLIQLKKKIPFIGTIKLLGGEPLLHTHLDQIIRIVRAVYPNSVIEIATNGLLIDRLNDPQLEMIQKSHAVIYITEYEPTRRKRENIERILMGAGISFRSIPCKNFTKWLTGRDDSDPQKAWENCGAPSKCRNLRGGILSKCSVVERMRKLTEQFGLEFNLQKGEDYIDIYEDEYNINKILETFSKPSNICKYCAEGKRWFPWQPANGKSKLSDYIIGADEQNLQNAEV